MMETVTLTSKHHLIGPDLSVPFEGKKLMLGAWQQIVLIELDVRPRDRTIIVHSMAE